MNLLDRLSGRRPDAERPLCLVCGAAYEPERKVEFHKDRSKVLRVLHCPTCGFVQLPGNTKEYSSGAVYGRPKRVGTEVHPGREFHMAQMAADILGRPDLDVLICGAGVSLDFRHVQALSQVRSVTVSDVQNFNDAPHYLEVGQPSPHPFDIVVACEIVEHFDDPRDAFGDVFDYLGTDGLLICSTNIYDGSDLTKHAYPFIKGHVAYYSPQSLRILAGDRDLYVDFRVPKVATGSAGPRKRYVIFTDSVARLADISGYFGARTYAPSE